MVDWLVLKLTTHSLKKILVIFIYLCICSLVWLYPRAAKKDKKSQGSRKESWKENKVTMRKYQWLQKHKQDTTALNTLPVRQTSPSNCDKTCVASPLLLLLTCSNGTTREGEIQMMFGSRNGLKGVIISSLAKTAEHILLLGSLNIICRRISCVHPFSRYITDP